MEYRDLVLLILPYVVNIFGLVEFIKGQGVSGKTLTWVSFGIGLVYGVATIIAAAFPEYKFVLTAVVFLPTMGLVASGYYKFVDDRTGRTRG